MRGLCTLRAIWCQRFKHTVTASFWSILNSHKNWLEKWTLQYPKAVDITVFFNLVFSEVDFWWSISLWEWRRRRESTSSAVSCHSSVHSLSGRWSTSRSYEGNNLKWGNQFSYSNKRSRSSRHTCPIVICQGGLACVQPLLPQKESGKSVALSRFFFGGRSGCTQAKVAQCRACLVLIIPVHINRLSFGFRTCLTLNATSIHAWGRKALKYGFGVVTYNRSSTHKPINLSFAVYFLFISCQPCCSC